MLRSPGFSSAATSPKPEPSEKRAPPRGPMSPGVLPFCRQAGKIRQKSRDWPQKVPKWVTPGHCVASKRPTASK